jgi:hypothetical protein
VLSLDINFVGDGMAVSAVRGLNETLPPSSGPLHAGQNSGFWVELRDDSEQVKFTRLVSDPRIIEGPTADGGLTSGWGGACSMGTFSVDLPNNDPTATQFVVFGDPFGTQGPAVELARWHF